MKKIKVGIMGCANIAVRSMGPAFQIHPSYELVAFAGRNLDKTIKTANQFKCEALLGYQSLIDRKDIDLIYIPLPNSLHKEWVVKSLNSGKHVICEKSLGCNLSEVEEMVAIARINNKLLLENFQFRFHSQNHFVKRILNDGDIGEIRCFRSSFGFPPFKDISNIRYKNELGGGALYDAGAYTVKAAYYILGEDLEVKAANLNISRDLGVDIYGGIYMQNSKGQLAELSFGFDNYYQCNYEIWGSKGKLLLSRAFTAPPGFAPSLIIEKKETKKEIILPSDDHFTNILSHAFSCIQNDSYEQENTQNLIQSASLEQVIKCAFKYYY